MRSKKLNEHIAFGKEILKNLFIRENIDFSELAVNKILKDFNLKTIDNLYALIGSGSITASSVLKKIFPELKFNSRKKVNNTINKPIKLKGLTLGMSYHLAGCCSPIKGDNIVGIATAGLGVSVHTIECEILESYSDSPERWIDISWDTDNEINQLLIARISITMRNKTGSLGKVSTVNAKNNGNISNIRFNNRKTDFFETFVEIEVRYKNHLSNIIAALRLLTEVSSCERIKG